MSVYLKSIVDGLGLTDAHVVHAKQAGWAVAAIPVQKLIDEDQVVVADPIVDPPQPHPCDRAHALVQGDKSPKARRERIAKSSPLVHVVA